MITNLQIKNFKSWLDSGHLPIAPLTGFFGSNSSGKTSILQVLLLLKQTVESSDRKRALSTGDDRTSIDLGTFYDLVFNHKEDLPIEFGLSWKFLKEYQVMNPKSIDQVLFAINNLTFQTVIKEIGGRPATESFYYSFDTKKFGMSRSNKSDEYSLIHDNYNSKRIPGRVWPLPPPIKCYGFPDEAIGYFQNNAFLPDFVLAFEKLFREIFYLGPLREYPRRSYTWAGDDPGGVGVRGKDSIPALLAKRQNIVFSFGKGRKLPTMEERVGYWLREMGLISDFILQPIAKNRKEYELKVRTTQNSPYVSIADVGFGISQILPILVLCYYVPENSVIILEQPEIHLHPSVQAILADLFIEVVTKGNVQIILESHSEHLLRRLQRRIAEDVIKADQAALYFCKMQDSQSKIDKLDIDLFGNITNWPAKFFGDEIGDLNAMIQATAERTKR
jgi:AAA15 family ATPase/GTPase